MNSNFIRLYLHSVACDTQKDAVQRIADTGAKGGLTGTGNGERAFIARYVSFALCHTEIERAYVWICPVLAPVM